MKVCVICGCDCSNRRNDVIQPTCDACASVFRNQLNNWEYMRVKKNQEEMNAGVKKMENFGEFGSILFNWFMVCISAFAFMCGIMSIVYMLLHWG